MTYHNCNGQIFLSDCSCKTALKGPTMSGKITDENCQKHWKSKWVFHQKEKLTSQELAECLQTPLPPSSERLLRHRHYFSGNFILEKTIDVLEGLMVNSKMVYEAFEIFTRKRTVSIGYSGIGHLYVELKSNTFQNFICSLIGSKQNCYIHHFAFRYKCMKEVFRKKYLTVVHEINKEYRYQVTILHYYSKKGADITTNADCISQREPLKKRTRRVNITRYSEMITNMIIFGIFKFISCPEMVKHYLVRKFKVKLTEHFTCNTFD